MQHQNTSRRGSCNSFVLALLDCRTASRKSFYFSSWQWLSVFSEEQAHPAQLPQPITQGQAQNQAQISCTRHNKDQHLVSPQPEQGQKQATEALALSISFHLFPLVCPALQSLFTKQYAWPNAVSHQTFITHYYIIALILLLHYYNIITYYYNCYYKLVQCYCIGIFA